MKKGLLIVFATIAFTKLFAQLTEGNIVYEQLINTHRKNYMLNEQLKNYMPEFTTKKFELNFKEQISSYKPLVELEKNDGMQPQKEGVRITMTSFNIGGPKGETIESYKDQSTATAIDVIEFSSNTYIVKDSIKKQSWVLQDETKNIMGYECKKAIYTYTEPLVEPINISFGFNANEAKQLDTAKIAETPKTPKTKEVKVVAWYAPDIASPAGPDEYGGLPGLILMVDIDNGVTIYTATELKKSANKKALKQPTKGKEITKEELEALRKKMLDNMKQQNGSGKSGVNIIKVGF